MSSDSTGFIAKLCSNLKRNMASSTVLMSLEDVKQNFDHPQTEYAARKSPTRKQRVWKRTWVGFCVMLVFAIPGVIPFGFMLASFAASNSNPQIPILGDCNGVEIFSAGSLLAPDITLGDFTLTEVRAIDLSWNLVAGRIVPFLMTLVSIRAGAEAMARIAENTAITYDTFAALTVNANTLSGLRHLCKAVVHTPGWRAKWTLWFLSMTTVFLLSLPTLIGAEGGYVRNQQIAFKLDDGSIVTEYPCDYNYSNFSNPDYPIGACIPFRNVTESVCVDADGY